MERLTERGFVWDEDSIFRDIDRWSLAQCLNKLADYENAEEDGLLLRLPSKRTERLTEYHCGVAVIKDKEKLKEAMAKLAAYEDIEEKGLLNFNDGEKKDGE